MITCTCQQCGKDFLEKPARIEDGRGKFCSQPCHNAYRRSARIDCVCVVCGKGFSANPSQVKRGRTRYCSVGCAAKGRTRDVGTRFWENVEKTATCWNWIGGLNDAGYGILSVGGHKGKATRVHRISWDMFHAESADGLEVCHKCDNPRCVRPDHLFLGTQADNMRDKEEKKRGVYGDDHYSRAAPERMARGERRGHAKLTEDKVRYIRTRYAQGGILHKELAAEVGVSASVISEVIARKVWAHVA